MLKLIPSALTFSWSGLTIPDYMSMWKVVSTTLEKRHVANATVSLTGWFIFSWKAYLHCRLSAILGRSGFILVENVWNKVYCRHKTSNSVSRSFFPRNSSARHQHTFFKMPTTHHPYPNLFDMTKYFMKEIIGGSLEHLSGCFWLFSSKFRKAH